MSNTPPNIDFRNTDFGRHFSKITTLPSTKQIDKDVKRIDTIDKLIEISDIDTVLKIIQERMGVSKDEVISANNWISLGFDDFDEIEFIMDMEKWFDCYIDDDTANKVLQMSPMVFCQLLCSKKRDNKLNELGI